jgi:hypothetical protein
MRAVMAVTTETLVGLRVTFLPEALMAVAEKKSNAEETKTQSPDWH